MSTPIFVIGPGRSGTTWLSNLLLGHSAITGIDNPRGRGIMESLYFSAIDGRYGSLENFANFIEFAQVISASEYFVAAGADLDFIHSLYPASYAEVFRAVMDRFASEAGASCWLEKSPEHTLRAEAIAAYYPDARFITILRSAEGRLASWMRMQQKSLERASAVAGDNVTELAEKLGMEKAIRRFQQVVPDNRLQRMSWLTREVVLWQHLRKLMRRLARRFPDRVLSLTYEELLADTPAQAQKVCRFLSLDFEERMLGSRYRPNTSFDSPGAKSASMLRPGEQRWVRTLAAATGIVPQAVLQTAFDMRARRRPRQSLPSFFFDVKPAEFIPRAAPPPEAPPEAARKSE